MLLMVSHSLYLLYHALDCPIMIHNNVWFNITGEADSRTTAIRQNTKWQIQLISPELSYIYHLRHYVFHDGMITVILLFVHLC